MTSQTPSLPQAVLTAYAEGRVHHLNRGECPDQVAGYDSRDNECPVCNALDALSSMGGQAVLTDAEIIELRKQAPHYASPPWASSIGFARAIESAILSRMGGESVPAGWRAGVEAVAALIQKKADDFAQQFGHDDMGALSFGSGQNAQVKADHHSTLCELADEVRTLAARSAPPSHEGEDARPTEAMLDAGRTAVMARDVSSPNFGPADHYRMGGHSTEGIPVRLLQGQGKMSKSHCAELVWYAMRAARAGGSQ